MRQWERDRGGLESAIAKSKMMMARCDASEMNGKEGKKCGEPDTRQ